MKLFKLILPFILLFLFQCTRQPNTPLSEIPEAGKISFSIDMINAPAEVVKMQGVLAREGQDTVFFNFEMQDSAAAAVVENLAAGFWTLQVDAYNSDNIIIYTGKARVNVQPGVVTPVYLHLNPSTGSLEIVVTWGEHNPDLLAYFPFDKTLDDYSIFHNDARQFGEVHFAPGIHGAAVAFDGIDDYLQIAHLDAYNGDEKAISFWFYKNNDSIKDTPNLDDVEGLIVKSYDTGLRRDFSFALALQNPPFSMTFVNYQYLDSLTVLKLNKAIQPRTWYHVVGTYNETSTRFYINGELIVKAPITHPIYHNDAPIIVGTVPPPGRYFTRFFNGKMDELAIFSHALTQNEIQNI